MKSPSRFVCSRGIFMAGEVPQGRCLLHEVCKEGATDQNPCYLRPNTPSNPARAWSHPARNSQEPENAEVRCNLSYALLKECKYHKALEAADGAVAIDPTMERAHFRKGLAHAALEE